MGISEHTICSFYFEVNDISMGPVVPHLGPVRASLPVSITTKPRARHLNILQISSSGIGSCAVYFLSRMSDGSLGIVGEESEAKGLGTATGEEQTYR